jgi:hypothetical protein
MMPFLCAYCGGIVREDRCRSCGAQSRNLPGIRFSNADFEAMSEQCPVKVVFNADLPSTEDKDFFPVSRPTSLLTESGLAHFTRRAWSHYCRLKRGCDDRMKSMPLTLVVSSDTLGNLRRGMREHDLRALAEGLIEGSQVMVCDQMARHDFINGSWVNHSAKIPTHPLYENAEFEDSLILSPDCKTPLIAIRHTRCVIMDLLTCTDS